MDTCTGNRERVDVWAGVSEKREENDECVGLPEIVIEWRARPETTGS